MEFGATTYKVLWAWCGDERPEEYHCEPHTCTRLHNLSWYWKSTISDLVSSCLQKEVHHSFACFVPFQMHTNLRTTWNQVAQCTLINNAMFEIHKLLVVSILMENSHGFQCPPAGKCVLGVKKENLLAHKTKRNCNVYGRKNGNARFCPAIY